MIQIIIFENIWKWHFWKRHSWKCQNQKCKSETTRTLNGLFKNRKCQGTQHRLGWCSAMILPNLSHFHNVKKMVQGVWNIFCLVQAVMEGPKWPIFWDPAPFFLPYKNGSNLVESLLSTISSFAEIPGIFDFWKDQLLNAY